MLGKIRSVKVAETIDVAGLDDCWQAPSALAGGMVVIDMGYHMLDHTIGLLGQPFLQLNMPR